MREVVQVDLIELSGLRGPLRSFDDGYFSEKKRGYGLTPLQHPLKVSTEKKEAKATTTPKTQADGPTVPVIWFSGSPEFGHERSYFYEMLGSMM